MLKRGSFGTSNVAVEANNISSLDLQAIMKEAQEVYYDFCMFVRFFWKVFSVFYFIYCKGITYYFMNYLFFITYFRLIVHAQSLSRV